MGILGSGSQKFSDFHQLRRTDCTHCSVNHTICDKKNPTASIGFFALLDLRLQPVLGKESFTDTVPVGTADRDPHAVRHNKIIVIQ